jgi:hypothetical protein
MIRRGPPTVKADPFVHAVIGYCFRLPSFFRLPCSIFYGFHTSLTHPQAVLNQVQFALPFLRSLSEKHLR